MTITDDICPICFGDLLWIGDMDSYYCEDCDVSFTREELEALTDEGYDWLSEPDE